MEFHPDEILFSPTARCNLNCSHCVNKASGKDLSIKTAEKFLAQCKSLGIKGIGFTGGEPFLAPSFLNRIVKKAVEQGMLFTRIMTNGVWYKTGRGLVRILKDLSKAGYDGSICVSTDAFHSQSLNKLAFFIETTLDIWNRPDVLSIACVTGRHDGVTRRKIEVLARLLNARLVGFIGRHPCIKGESLFIKIYKIELCPIGKDSKLSSGWDERTLREDYCSGPGNVFLVESSGEAKPCCGYASDCDGLSIGNIKRDSARGLVAKARKNRFVHAVFHSGLSQIRKRLERAGVEFPGRTGNHCYLCRYILTNVDPLILAGCLDRKRWRRT